MGIPVRWRWGRDRVCGDCDPAGADVALDRGDFCDGGVVGDDAGKLFPGDGGEADIFMQPDSPPFSFEGMERAAGGGAVLVDLGVVRGVWAGDGEVAVKA